ncbi:hypothetical protein EVAR_64995_1 [Eumeta japonica]|uniref:Uncharacterized protein n=1 Tax=Eumeta variegata TaxID=151549 RepID=A0A4C1ZW16_EUMVA|nr:hypothetical protein EVAR_64995_1 [Eumeta japonica]
MGIRGWFAVRRGGFGADAIGERPHGQVRRRCGQSGVRMFGKWKIDIVPRIERDILRWFGHLERVNESSLTKQFYRANTARLDPMRASYSRTMYIHVKRTLAESYMTSSKSESRPVAESREFKKSGMAIGIQNRDREPNQERGQLKISVGLKNQERDRNQNEKQ